MNTQKKATGEFTFSSVLERSDNKLWGSHVRVPAAIARQLKDGTSRRVVCTVNGSQTFQCAILYYKKDLPVISVNKKIQTVLRVGFGDEVTVVLKKDSSAFGLPLPEEFAEVLRQDADGKKLFLALTPGKQRTLLYIVNNVKDPAKKIFRALAIIHHLKEHKGTINYKKLGMMLKNPLSHPPPALK